MPGSLRHDDNHAGIEIENFVALGRSQRQGYAAFEDLHDFVAIQVAFPLGRSGKSGSKYASVPVIGEPGEVSRGVRMPGAALKECGFFPPTRIPNQLPWSFVSSLN